MAAIASLAGASEATLTRTLENFAKAPHQLTAKEREFALQYAYEIYELRTVPPETLSARRREAFQGPRPYGLPSFVMPPLPREFDTRSRKMFDEMHIFLLNAHPRILWFQLLIDEHLRNNAEWEPFSLLSFLNHVSEHLTGKQRFMMMEQYTQSKEHQMAMLFYLNARKPDVHTELLHMLAHATQEDQPAHGKACTCPFRAHIARVAAATVLDRIKSA